MTIRSIILPVFLGVSLASIYFLPSAGKIAQSAVKMDLPQGFGTWQFNKIPASEAEINTLSKDTEFSKAICLRAREGEFGEDGRVIPDRVDLSIVLSGADMSKAMAPREMHPRHRGVISLARKTRRWHLMTNDSLR